jgi:hypothetical protein
MTKVPNPFRWFDLSPEVSRLAVIMYVRCALNRGENSPLKDASTSIYITS